MHQTVTREHSGIRLFCDTSAHGNQTRLSYVLCSCSGDGVLCYLRLIYSRPSSKEQKCRVLLNVYLASPAAIVVCMFCRCFYVFTISVRPITSASIDICRPRPSCRSTGQTDGRTPYRLHRRNSAGTVGRMTRISRYAPNNGNFVDR